ncbi:putative exported protein [Candidatus Paraburkholderia calva]|nr:putative exported protein [Candidatus Paraburkholderia calva]
MKRTTILLALVTALCGSTAIAQTAASSHDAMSGMKMDKPAGGESESPSTAAFQAADHSMMSGMSNIQYTGAADRDFVAHMIPHHEGAVEIAKVELKYGKDAKLRKLAKDIIAAQDKEIAFMKQWLAAHPQK